MKKDRDLFEKWFSSYCGKELSNHWLMKTLKAVDWDAWKTSKQKKAE